MSKPMTRYSPSSHEVETGIGCYAELCMQEDNNNGGYINRTDLLTKLNTMKDNACDPAETDTLNTILKLLEG